MKKIVLAVAGIAVLGAAGWSGLWFMGRGKIDTRLDAEIQALTAQGYEITHGAREIGGFPFGYAVRHRDVVVRDQQGVSVRLPEVLTEVTAEDADRLVTTLPEKFQMEIAVQTAAVAEPETLQLDFEAKNLVLVSDGRPGARQEFTGSADSVLMVTGGKAPEGTMAVEFVKPEQRTTLPDPASGEQITGVTTIERIDYAFGAKGTDGTEISFEGTVDAVQMTGKANIWGQAMAAALFTGLDAVADGAYQTGASRFTINTKPAEGGQGGTFSGSSASSAGTVAIKAGRMEIAASSRENEVTLAADPPFESTGGKPVSWAMRSAEAIYAVPIAPSEAPVPFSLRFALDEVIPDEVLWNLIDPATTIARDPGRLIIDVEGTARLTQALSDVPPGAPPPVEVGNVSVKALDVTALGAGITTRGDVEFLQPVWVPAGTMTVTFTNLLEVANKLVEAGVLAPKIHQTMALMSAVYTRPGEAPGELVSEVVMGMDGITINGQPFGVGR